MRQFYCAPRRQSLILCVCLGPCIVGTSVHAQDCIECSDYLRLQQRLDLPTQARAIAVSDSIAVVATEFNWLTTGGHH